MVEPSVKVMYTSSLPVPSITKEPQDVSTRLGSNATFRVSARPVPALYQWQRNGLLLVGETNRVLRMTDVRVDQAGDYNNITVVVSDGKKD